MKPIKNRLPYVFIILGFATLSGCETTCEIDKWKSFVIHNEKEILTAFSQASLLKRGDLYVVNIDDSDSSHLRYSVKEISEGDLLITQVKRIFPHTRREEAVYDQANLNNQVELNQQAIQLIQKMNSLSLTSIGRDFHQMGIPITLYTSEGSVLYYIKDINQISSDRWKELISTSSKLTQNWYLRCE